MKPRSFMIIAGEPSGDRLAAELVRALRQTVRAPGRGSGRDIARSATATFTPRFFGAGGPHMAEAAVDLAVDMTRYSVIGLFEALKKYFQFRRLFTSLLRLAISRQPDGIIGVDFSGFNRRFALAVKRYVRYRPGVFHNWSPKIIQYVSPQVWASRPGRAQAMARDYDLVLSIFPFEKAWYRQHAAGLRVEFVGHPILDRYGDTPPAAGCAARHPNLVLLLPGSRREELQRHGPIVLAAARLLAARKELQFLLVLPTADLVEQLEGMELSDYKYLSAERGCLGIQAGRLPEALGRAKIALASTGTVTVECAYFGVPTVALYVTSWGTYQIGKRIVNVNHLAMPNILAGETLIPEFIQDRATPANLAEAAFALLDDPARYAQVKDKLMHLTPLLGRPGASRRAAEAVWSLY